MGFFTSFLYSLILLIMKVVMELGARVARSISFCTVRVGKMAQFSL